MLKTTIDTIAKRKARDILLKTALEKGINLEGQMTDNIDQKLDELLQAIIDDIGYTKLAQMGLSIQ